MANKQLSTDFFEKVPELKVIEEPFPFLSVSEQLKTRDIDNEFELIRALTQTKKHKLRLRMNDGRETKKNRYPEQSIYQHSRIQLHSEQYINGNNIINTNFNKMIMTQGPLQETQEDFTQMIIENEITCVIMLCDFVEGGKNRCYDYTSSWMSQNTQIKGFIKMSDMEKNEYLMQHLHYSSWPDKGVPFDPAQLFPLIQVALKHDNILVHCSAGLGRSGVVVAILNILKGISENQTGISIFGEVRRLRESRYGAVQNNQQYRFIYEFIENYFST